MAYHIFALNQTPTKHHVANFSLGVAGCGHEPNTPSLPEIQAPDATHKLIWMTICVASVVVMSFNSSIQPFQASTVPTSTKRRS